MPQLSIRFFHVFCDIYFKRNTLGACPRTETVARKNWFEAGF